MAANTGRLRLAGKRYAARIWRAIIASTMASDMFFGCRGSSNWDTMSWVVGTVNTTYHRRLAGEIRGTGLLADQEHTQKHSIHTYSTRRAPIRLLLHNLFALSGTEIPIFDNTMNVVINGCTRWWRNTALAQKLLRSLVVCHRQSPLSRTGPQDNFVAQRRQQHAIGDELEGQRDSSIMVQK